MPSLFELIAILLTLTALFGGFNQRFLHLPHTIGLLVMGLAASLLLLGLDLALPRLHLRQDLAALLRQVDFSAALLDGMLAFLLFAGALHVDLVALCPGLGLIGSTTRSARTLGSAG